MSKPIPRQSPSVDAIASVILVTEVARRRLTTPEVRVLAEQVAWLLSEHHKAALSAPIVTPEAAR